MGSKRTMCFHALLLLSLFVAAPVWAQNGTITGVVTSANDASPIANALVEAIADGRTAGRYTTSGAGRYLISVPPGSYEVVVTAIGYRTTRQAGVTVTSGAAARADLTVEITPFVQEELVVTATGSATDPKRASETPASVSVIQERSIREQPSTTPADHLRSTPAVDVIESGVQSRNVVVRGFNNIFSGALLTLTDHRIAGVPSLRVNFLQFIPQTDEDIGRMEVVLGPASALYGPNTANGVLHILTKSPLEEQRTIVSIAGGEQDLIHGTFRTSHLLTADSTFGVKVSGQYMRANEWLYRDRGEDSVRAVIDASPATGAVLCAPGLAAAECTTRLARIGARDFDIERWAGDVRADWQPSDRFTAVLSGGLTNTNSIELTGIGAGQVVDWKYSYAQLRATYDNLFAQTYINMSDAGETFLLRNGNPITDKSRVWVSQLQHRLNLGTRQKFAYGADFVMTMPITEGTINGRNEDDDEYSEIGGYLQSETAVHRMLDVVLAGRVDKHSELPEAVFSPRAALVFKPSRDHSFRATYNRAFSTPTSLNLFLDIDAGPLGALGPFGFRAHAQAPGRAGINLHSPAGTLQIRTPFAGGDPSTLRDVTPASIYNLQVTAIGLAAGLPATLQAYMRSLVADPAFAGVPVIVLDPLTNRGALFAPEAVQDIAGIEESTTSTFELGYKGLLAGRLILAADVWWSNQKNFTSPLITATPLVMMGPQQLVPFLVPRLTPVFIAQGLSPAAAQAQATTLATNMARLPGGIVSSAEVSPQGPGLVLTYINFGEVDLSGVDVAATALITDDLQLGVTASLVSDDFFRLPLGQRDTTVVALNAPKKKGTASLTYRNLDLGVNGQVRVRYTDEFPANSAGFVGLNCVDETLQGDCVQSYTLVDVQAGYELPINGASLQLSVSNVLDEKYQSFIGVPVIGRMAILRLRYAF